MSGTGRRVEAAVRPELLVWARESAGLDLEEAARKVRVTPERLASWEAGERRPTVRQLRELGRVYRRPLAVFYLPGPPRSFQAMHDFRRLPGEVAGGVSPQLRLEIRRARSRREIMVDLLRKRTEAPSPFTGSASLSEDPEIAGARARALLGLSMDEQRSFRTPHAALSGWRAALERAGVLVFQAQGVELEEMRGFSISAETLPVIVANIKDSPHGRIFTILHELAHLMVHQEGLCDLSEHASIPSDERSVEVWCNHVAGATLLPSDALLTDDLVASHVSSQSWDDDELGVLSSRYQVSMEAALRRLLILGRTTRTFYEDRRARLGQPGGPSRARRALRDSGFAPPDRLAVATAGHRFVRLVLDSYYAERITSSDLSEYLGVRLKHIPRIEAAVFGQPASGPAPA
jgi:Zn-dependent peptidase ImmA (M78 family)/transcriptional regulator with XRE-family HTH domain